ncbi:MAG: QacE family quaternary ammonium compound efflux SMR transporter [Candidatus Dactylopiibacterium carminicum]|uniref:Guanidinium exporter n=1 Tax=Candidatus Dactylopiibacterium carminicum TaxID=857335 RepID=A0A272EMW9_9RHOO|nr:multidrug efflux SMR transporter [Candidatus Dactylopiibacterium carminicum]KAF7597866.1 QacE family quaternary ammonium compound efflux SMR transporter [Candidatus Dactylopiibacterium carminicum]PAS91455.1 MAG: QacE family quaternary ammonium compound efflux SMR transporter [Candidatus Dactylopiibacterium carminicum]PAS92835.1 MAG: QacE family quaternary ammonium compound efflux SMR transporter [Candidatus Dactylopiibacterium carminicum]PAS95787.1 MAG: QacE family quaternary ammonium compou
MARYWLILGVAVVTEILWALSLKYIQQHPGPWPILASICLTGVNMVLLSFAMRGIPAGVAYAVWTGLGAVGVAIFGAAAFGDHLNSGQIASMAVVIAGVVGMKLTTG